MTTRFPLILCGLLVLTPISAAAQDTVNAVLAGTGNGGGVMRELDAADGSQLASATPFGPGFTGGVRVASGDINGDGTADFIAGSGHGAGQVTVLSGVDLSVLWAFTPFGPSYNGGVYVASGDIDGDTRDDVIVGAGNGSGGGGQVRVYSGASHLLLVTRTPFGPSYHHGVTVAAGDITGDSRDDLVAGRAIGGEARVLDGITGLTTMTLTPYGNFNGGVNVAAGDVNGDGRTDVITGPGGGGNVRQVKAFSGFDASLLISFSPYPTGPPTGVYVAAGKVDGDTRADIITGPGNGQQPRVKIFSGLDLSEISSFLAFDASFHGGVFVAGVLEDQGGPEFTSDDNTTFHVGVFNTFTVTTTFSSTPTLTSSGTLPTGVNFTDNGDGTATLDGIPADGSGGVYPLTFTADDGVNPPVMQSFTLTVQEVPEITSANSTTLLVGSAGSFTVTSDGYPDAAIAIGGDALPSGVGFVDNGDGTGTLSGTAAAGSGGIYNLTFTPSNAEGTGATQSFTLTVEEAPVITSANSVTFTVGQAGSFTVTTNGFPDPTIARGGVALPLNVTFVDNLNGTGTLSGTPQAGTGGSYAITFTATNSVGSSPTQNFTLNVQGGPAITSADNVTFAPGVAGQTFLVTTTGSPTNTISRTGTLPGGVTFTDNGNNTATIAGTPAAGTQSASPYAWVITAANGVLPDATQNFTFSVACPVITVSGAIPALVVNTPMATATFTQVGGNPPISWSATGLPTGVTINSASGDVTGTPTVTGTFNVTITATMGDCTGSKNQAVTVAPTATGDAYSGLVDNTQFVITGGLTANPGTPFVGATGTLIANDQPSGGVTATAGTFATFAGGSVTILGDGTFIYTPKANPAAAATTSDSFAYTVFSNTGGGAAVTSAPATVNLTLAGRVWYVLNTAGGFGNGQSQAPFNLLSNGIAASTADDTIYVYRGDGTTTNLATASLLKPGQDFIGQGAALVVNANTLVAAGGFPSIGNTLTLANNVIVNGIDMTTVANQGLVGGSVTGVAVTIRNLTTTTGTAVNLNGTGGTVLLTSVSANGATNGIVLNNTTGSFTVTGDGNTTLGGNGSGGTIQNTTGDGISLTATHSTSFNNMTIQGTALGSLTASGIRGTQVTNFTFTNGTINNVGHFPDVTNSFPDDSNIRFNTAITGTERNLSGVVTITNNVLNNATWHGVDIQNFNGTISSLTISGNSLTSGTTTGGGGTSKGSAIRVNQLGSAATVSHITTATIANNVIANFPGGAGIRVLGGNSNPAGSGGSLGTPGSATDIISITGNRIAGQSALNRMGTSAIIAALSGGNSGSRSTGNIDVSNNGTALDPMTNVAGTVISVANTGYATLTGTVDGNVIVANNLVASNGIGGGNGVVLANTETPDLTLTVTGNTISQTDGNGILLVGRGTSGSAKLRITGNTVGAPTAGARQGIRVDAGNATSLNDSVCLDIASNITAGSGGVAGIGLRKQGIVAGTNNLALHGFATSPANAAQTAAFVTLQNPGSVLGTAIISGDNFNFPTCSFP